MLIASLEILILDQWSAGPDFDILFMNLNPLGQKQIATITDFMPLEATRHCREVSDGGFPSQSYKSIQREPSLYPGIR